MTLVLTEISEYGIAMAADTAITFPNTLWPDGVERPRVLYGATKLRPVPSLNAGLSAWGMGSIEGIDTDIWTLNYISQNADQCRNLHDFARRLQSDLRRAVPEVSDASQLRWGNVGFHLAGYVDTSQGRLPAFYHIHNGESEYVRGVDPRIVNANLDFPPRRLSPGDFHITRNGDFRTVYADWSEILFEFLGLLEQHRGVRIPHPSLLGRAQFLAFQIRAIRDLYRLSNLVPGIGGDIIILTISERGIETYWNPLDLIL